MRLSILIVLTSAGLGSAADVTPEVLYKQHCAMCHDSPGATRAPALTVMRQMSPETIVNSLEGGLMKQQGAALALTERRSLAEWLTGKTIGTQAATSGMCENRAAPFEVNDTAWTGWGNGVDNHRFTKSSIDPSKLVLKWAFGFPGAAISFAQPSITGGRMFVGSAARKVYSLDAKTGCIYWIFEPQANVRAAITITPQKVALFADQLANVYAVDARNGELLWKTHVDEHRSGHVTGAPQFWRDRLYVPISAAEDGPSLNPKYECCTARGGVVALDAKTGTILWHTYSVAEEPHPTRKNSIGTQLWGPSGASIWAAPTIDAKRNRLYVGTGDNHSEPETKTSDAILAMDLDTGKIVWSKQLTEHDTFNIACVAVDQTNCPQPAGPDLDIGSSPMIVGNMLIVGQKAAVVHALDLDHNGEIKWQTRIGRGGPLGGIQWGMATDGTNVYVALSDVAAKPGTGIFGGPRFVADPKSGGGLFALRIDTGAKVWSAPPPDCGDRKNCSPAQSAAITAIPGAVFSGSVDGHIRAYSTKDGSILWDYDTVRDFKTVNGVAAKGGSMDGPGPVVVNGMVYVPSGYGSWGGNAGNVLLAFGQQ
jgi:polyvinyl alcohol dehydrogenase (cytochrome)